jgi:tetratricopeptide (TPR) repeat protein
MQQQQDNQFPLEEIIKRTIEANYGYVKNSDIKNSRLLEILSPIIVVCFQEHSPERSKQLEAALDTIDSLLIRESPLVSWVYYLMSDARKREGQLQSAVDFGMESLKIREEIYGSESNEVCICLDHLSSIFFDAQDYPKAIKFFMQASDIKWKMGYAYFALFLTLPNLS